MEINLVKYVSVELSKKFDFINQLSSSLNEYFKFKEYGNDVKFINIGVIYVSENFEFFFKPRKIKYTKERKLKKDSVDINLEKMIEMDIKLEFHSIINNKIDEQKKNLISQIYFNLVNIEKITNKKDFNFDLFNQDFISYLNLINALD